MLATHRRPGNRSRGRLPALLIAALALLGAGCTSTTAGGSGGLPPGETLDGERYDNPEALRAARTVVVVAFTVSADVKTELPTSTLESAAHMTSEEIVKVLRRSTELDAVGIGTGREGAELTVRGELTRYKAANAATDFFIGGTQHAWIDGEILDASGNVVGLFSVSQSAGKRDWYDEEEKSLQTLMQAAGMRIGTAIERQLR